MESDRTTHSGKFARIILMGLAAAAMSLLTSCGSDFCGCEFPPIIPPEPEQPDIYWYKTYVEAEYDREWYIPVTPRYEFPTGWAETAGINPDSLLLPMPTGLRVVTFTSTGANEHHNIEATGGEVPMESDTKRLLLYNNDTEYIVFNNPDSFDGCTATTRRRSGGFYSGNARVGSDTVSEPVRSQPDILYRRAMREQAVDSMLRSFGSDPAQIHVIPTMLYPAVHVYIVHFTFTKGLNHVLNGAAAMTGMSAGVNLSTGETLEETCTLMFDCEKTADGMTGTFLSFGAPGYSPENGELYHPHGRYGITLQLVLNNTKRVSYTIDVTAQMSAQPCGGVVMTGDIEVDDETAKPEGGGSFDVSVDPWGEPNDYEITL